MLPKTDEKMSPSKIIPLRIMLGIQIFVGLLWGVTFLFFSHFKSDMNPDHLEKMALLGCVYFTFILAAILIWKNPLQSKRVLFIIIFLNAAWSLSDLYFIFVYHLYGTPLFSYDYILKASVSGVLAIGLLLTSLYARVWK